MVKTTSFNLIDELDDWLRIEAARLNISKGKLIVRLCEMGRTVLESGAPTLEAYCVGREQNATADYLECPKETP